MKELYRIKRLHEVNEYSILYSMKCLNSNKIKEEDFDIGDCIENIMELMSQEAHIKKIKLIFEREPGFPKGAANDKDKFCLLIDQMLLFFVERATPGQIKLFAKLKNPDSSGFVLSFEISANKSEKITYNELENAFMRDNEPCDPEIRTCRLLIKMLKVDLDITDVNANIIKVALDRKSVV